MKILKVPGFTMGALLGVNEDGQCWAEMSCWGWVARTLLPPVIRPVEWTSASRWAPQRTVARTFGFSVNDEALIVYYGQQPGYRNFRDRAAGDRTWCWLLPWMQWNRTRYDFLNPDGTLHTSLHDLSQLRTVQATVPKIKFSFQDHDGEVICAEAYITETRWRRGTGRWLWLGKIAPPRIRRELQLSTLCPIGPDKNTWKGGITGAGIEMKPDEPPAAALLRWSRSLSSSGQPFSYITFR